MILLPWSENGNLSEAIMTSTTETTNNPFGNSSYNHFVSKFLDVVPSNAAIFVNNGFGALPREEMHRLTRMPTNPSLRNNSSPATAPLMDRSHHLFFPFIGGEDDRVALRFVLRLAKNPNVTATIMELKTSSMVSEKPQIIGSEDTTVGKSGTRIATLQKLHRTTSTEISSPPWRVLWQRSCSLESSLTPLIAQSESMTLLEMQGQRLACHRRTLAI